MRFDLRSSLARFFSGPVPVLVVAGVLAGMGSLPGHAELTDPAPVAWSVVDNGGNPSAQNRWVPYEKNGEPLYDSEGGSSTDTSNGGASFSGAQDIASGYPPIAGPGCTQVGDTQCGDKISAFFYYYDDGVAGVDGDVLFARMRVNGDPASAPGFTGGHWNFLLDIEQPIPNGTLDGFKELWIDVNGNFNGGFKADMLRLVYEDNPENDVSNDYGALGTLSGAGTCGGNSATGGTVINAFVACSAAGLTGDCRNGSGQDLSHTRVVDADLLDPDTGEYYVDVMVPASALKDNDGCYSYPSKFGDPETLVEGRQVVTDPSQFTLLYSTSNSATDPLQKDFVAEDFGDIFTTPVTLASFEARAEGGRVRFEWSTATETANAGFDIYELTADGWKRLNEHLIPSRALNSTVPQHYSFEADGSTGTQFKIVDISTGIKERGHGPFELDRVYGRPATAEPIDWAAIRQEHALRAGARRTAASSGAAKALAGGGTGLEDETGGKAAARQFPVCRLGVSETGLHRVTAAELAAAGCGLDGASAWAVALTNRGASVPVRVVTRSRVFGAGDFIEFYGEAEDSLYTRTNVYQLQVDRRLAKPVRLDRRAPPAQGQAPTAYAESLHVDNDRAYHFMSPSGDPWYDTRLLAYAGKPLRFDFPLDVDALQGGAATLEVGLWGVTDWPDRPDHHVKVLVNDVEVADRLFDGLVLLPLTVDLPAGLLREGENTLSLLMPADTGVRFDMVNLDTYGVEYPRGFVARDGSLDFEADARVLEVNGLPSDRVVVYRRSGSEVWLSSRVDVRPSGDGFRARFAGGAGSARYLVASEGSLLRPALEPQAAPADIVSGAAEYLVIAHPDFVSGLAPLVAAREAQGWQVRVVAVDDVFSTFSFGIFDPGAIRASIAHAVESMGTRAVLLVGGDTFDYLDNLGVGSLSFIPTLYTNTGSGATFTPTDALLADADGDLVPDVAIGRLPVRTGAELAAVIAKTLAYETGGHSYTAVFAADGDEPGTPFTGTSLELVNGLPAGWHVTRAHIDESGVAGARAALLGAIDQGVALTSFIGHSGPNVWTFDGLFDTEDVALLANEGMPTVVSQWGCWNTYFVEPEVNTMAHALMLRQGGGAAAVMGAATITTYREDDAFAALLQERLTTPGKPIGEAVLEAKRALAAENPGMLEVILGLNLLGDPALVVAP